MISGMLYAEGDDSASPEVEGTGPGTEEEEFQIPKNYGSRFPSKMLILIAAVAVVIVVAAAVLLLYKPAHGTSTTTTITSLTATTTIPYANLTKYQVDSCTTISRPGIYNVTKNITTSNTTAPCIEITSGDVVLLGGGAGITGSGPFVQSSRPSYGVYVAKVSGVTIQDLVVSKFSYGVYLEDVTNSTVSNVKVLNTTVSGIYLNDSSYDTLSHDTAYSSESNSGGIFIGGGGENILENSSSMFNAYYGLYLNSSGNIFNSDTFSDNPVDLECNINAYYRNTNIFEGSSCQVSAYCNFAVCKVQNIPYNINGTTLQKSVSSCGSINNEGVYTVSGNISMTQYVNTSNPSTSRFACITINSPDVRLDCNNNTIQNADYGVVVAGLYNTSVVNCDFRNDTYGLYDRGTIGTVINNIKASYGVYGVYLNSTTGTLVSNVSGYGDVYGLYMNTSSGASLYGIDMRNNTYGVYINGQDGNQYYGGSTLNNTKGDFFCSISAYNSSQNIFHPITCGTTDCQWANSCSKTIPLPLAVTPVYSCATISSPGSYVLKSGLLSKQGTCVVVSASNVTFNCNDEPVEGPGFGTAFYVQGRENVTFDTCPITEFGTAFNVTNSSFVKITDANITDVSYGVYESNAIFSEVLGSTVTTFSKAAFMFSKLNNTVVENDTATESGFDSEPFSFTKAYADIIANNSAENYGSYGFGFYSSLNNEVVNNTQSGNGPEGYYCDPSSSGLYAQHNNGVNYGVGKVGCTWMIELNPEVTQQCNALLSSSTVELGQDMLYTYGGTCFSVINENGTNANNTFINCNNHTILATHGGTFLQVNGSSGVQMENCYLKGFTTGVYSNGADTVVLNDTIANARVGVELDDENYGLIKNVTFTNSSNGVELQDTRYGVLKDSLFTKDNISLEMSGVFSEDLVNNRANFGNIGFYLLNSTDNIFQDNTLLNQSNSGIICNGGSENKSTINTDQGGNICSGDLDCKWMTASPECSPT